MSRVPFNTRDMKRGLGLIKLMMTDNRAEIDVDVTPDRSYEYSSVESRGGVTTPVFYVKLTFLGHINQDEVHVLFKQSTNPVQLDPEQAGKVKRQVKAPKVPKVPKLGVKKGPALPAKPTKTVKPAKKALPAK